MLQLIEDPLEQPAANDLRLIFNNMTLIFYTYRECKAFCATCGMFLWRGNTVRHFKRNHNGKGQMLKEGRKPTAPIYQNMESFQKDPFNVKPKPWPKKLA